MVFDDSRSVEAMLQCDGALQRLRRDTRSGGLERSHVPQPATKTRMPRRPGPFRSPGERRTTSRHAGGAASMGGTYLAFAVGGRNR